MEWISVLNPTSMFGIEQVSKHNSELYSVGNAHAYLYKQADSPTSTYSLAGRLIASRSGWLLLEVPNSLVRGAFDALHEPGVELPPSHGKNFNAHITVAKPEELESIGGIDKITERGHHFHYQLGPIQSVVPEGWDEISRCWFIRVRSPELQKLRKSYGLSPLPQGENEDHPFHITIAARKKSVLYENDVSKAAGAETFGASSGIGVGTSIAPDATELAHEIQEPTTDEVSTDNDADTADETASASGQGSTRPFSGKEAKDNNQHLCVTGHSGAGKSTFARLASKIFNMPIYDIDGDRLWKKSKVKDDPLRYKPGTKSFDKFNRIRKKLVDKALRQKKPTIIEGAQLLVDPDRLKDHKVVLVDTPEDRVVKQRLKRDAEDGKLQRDGRVHRESKAKELIEGLRSQVETLRNNDDVIKLTLPEGHFDAAAEAKDEKHAGHDPIVPTIAIDLDGTIAEHHGGKHVDGKFGKIREGAKEVIKGWKDKGYRIIIWTSRDDIQLLEKWLEKHEIPYDEINKNSKAPSNLSPKVVASVYVDDRAVNARRDWSYIEKHVDAVLDSGKSRIPLPVVGHYEPKQKIKRDAFLYMDSRVKDFGQCSSCRAFTGKSCVKFPKGNTVSPDGSCGLYEYGKGDPDMVGKEVGTSNKEEAGYVLRPVRCENCAYFHDEEGHCELFEKLNKEWPHVFDLEKKVEKRGCCNAHIARAEEVKESAVHGRRAGSIYIAGDTSNPIPVCPYCDRNLYPEDIYTDIKGWTFCRRCLAKGKGSITLPNKHASAKEWLKLAYSGALGSGAESGQTTSEPPRMVQSDGSTPNYPEDQAVTDVTSSKNLLDTYARDPDPEEYDLDMLKQAVDDAMAGTEETEVSDNTAGIQLTGRITGGYPVYQGVNKRPIVSNGAGEPQTGSSTALSAPPVEDGAKMQLDSTTAEMGPLKNFTA